ATGYGTSNGMNDVLNRLESLSDGTTTLANYTYLGASTVVRIDYPQPQVRLDLWGGTTGTFAGLDNFGRIIDQHWANYNTSSDVDRVKHGYDHNSDRVYRENTL